MNGVREAVGYSVTKRPKPFTVLTNKVVWSEDIIVPNLHGEDWKNVLLCLCQAIEVFFFLDNHDILSCEVFQGEHKSPVKVPFTVQCAIVNISLLRIVNSTKPAIGNTEQPN